MNWKCMCTYMLIDWFIFLNFCSALTFLLSYGVCFTCKIFKLSSLVSFFKNNLNRDKAYSVPLNHWLFSTHLISGSTSSDYPWVTLQSLYYPPQLVHALTVNPATLLLVLTGLLTQGLGWRSPLKIKTFLTRSLCCSTRSVVSCLQEIDWWSQA